MMRILLVRHGESEWNVIQKLQGQADVSLSDLGKQQALTLKPVIESIQPDHVISSDLQRVKQTAALLGYDQPELSKNLREISVGDWTGKSIPDLQRDEPDHYLDWRAGTYTPPNGENWKTFKIRTANAISQIHHSENSPKTLLVVAHGGVIRALLESFLGIIPKKIIPVGPASLTIFRSLFTEPDETRLELFNYQPMPFILEAPD